MPFGVARGVRLLDRATAPLEVAVPDGAVEIEHAVLDVLEDLEVERALVHLLHDRDRSRGEERDEHVPQWIEYAIHAVADAVTDGQRLERREHEVRPGPEAVHAERLAGVGIALLDVKRALRDVDEADHTDRGVHAEARELATGATESTLEQVVHETFRHAEVVEGAIECALRDVGQDSVPSLRRRF